MDFASMDLINFISMGLMDMHAEDILGLRPHHQQTPQTPRTERLFNGDPTGNLSHEAYCDYYRRQWHLIAGHSDGHYVAVHDHGGINEICQNLLDGLTRKEIIANLKSRSSLNILSDDAYGNSINLAARLLLMLKFGVVKHQTVPRGILDWNDGVLADFVGDYFNQPPVLNCDHVRLPKTFNAWSIEAVGGIKVDFTDNLADHLLLVEDDSKVLVFHYASFLECRRNSMLPDRLVHETLRTLALLFPQSEFSRSSRGPRRKWLQVLFAQQEHVVIDSRLALCGNLTMEDRQIERFFHWRDRLVVLKQAYDDATPRTLAQWWHDRRNGVQWYTFWVAILVLIVTIFLGVLQCVEGALQVYKAYQTSR